MSENPFRSPQPVEAAFDYSSNRDNKPAPGALTAVLIICMILGGFGFMGSCFGSIGTAANYAVMKSTPPKPNDPGAKFTQKMNEVNSAATIPNMILLGINFILAPLMFIGALGSLNRKPWGRNLLRWSLIAATVFVVLRSIVGAFIQIKMGSTFDEAFSNLPNKGGPDPQTMASVMSGIFWVVFALTVLWTLVQLGFYLWSFFYLNRPEVRTYLGSR